MVKGVSRQVIVVRQPDRRLFEQAIFIVKEEALTQGGVTADQVLSEARRVARGYVRHSRQRPPSPWRWGAAGVFLGALAASLIWTLLTLL